MTTLAEFDSILRKRFNARILWGEFGIRYFKALSVIDGDIVDVGECAASVIENRLLTPQLVSDFVALCEKHIDGWPDSYPSIQYVDGKLGVYPMRTGC